MASLHKVKIKEGLNCALFLALDVCLKKLLFHIYICPDVKLLLYLANDIMKMQEITFLTSAENLQVSFCKKTYLFSLLTFHQIK